MTKLTTKEQACISSIYINGDVLVTRIHPAVQSLINRGYIQIKSIVRVGKVDNYILAVNSDTLYEMKVGYN